MQMVDDHNIKLPPSLIVGGGEKLLLNFIYIYIGLHCVY